MYKKSAGSESTHPAELFCLIGVHGNDAGAEHLTEDRRADRRAAAALLDHDDAVIRLDDSGGKYVSFKMEFDR